MEMKMFNSLKNKLNKKMGFIHQIKMLLNKRKFVERTCKGNKE